MGLVMSEGVGKVKRSAPATVRGLPTVEAAMERARAAEEKLARQIARRTWRTRLLWLATGLLIGFAAGWFA